MKESVPPTGICSESKRATGVEGKQRTDSHQLWRSGSTHEQLGPCWIYCESQVLACVIGYGCYGQWEHVGVAKEFSLQVLMRKSQAWRLDYVNDVRFMTILSR